MTSSGSHSASPRLIDRLIHSMSEVHSVNDSEATILISRITPTSALHQPPGKLSTDRKLSTWRTGFKAEQFYQPLEISGINTLVVPVLLPLDNRKGE